MRKNIFLVLLLVGMVSCSNGQSGSGQTQLTASGLAEQISHAPDAIILDVRTGGEFDNGHLENAVNIDWNAGEFLEEVLKLDTSIPVFVYCQSGKRSAAAAQVMRENGFGKVYELSGGILEWRAEGLPEVKGKSGAAGMTVAQYQALLDTDKLVLIDFYADWCAPCRKMKPHLEKISVELADRVVLVRIDADKNQELCQALEIRSLPTLKLYNNKTMIWEHIGLIDESGIREKLENNQN